MSTAFAAKYVCILVFGIFLCAVFFSNLNSFPRDLKCSKDNFMLSVIIVRNMC